MRTRRDVGHGAWGMGHETCWHADGMLMRPLCLSYSLPAGGDENADALAIPAHDAHVEPAGTPATRCTSLGYVCRTGSRAGEATSLCCQSCLSWALLSGALTACAPPKPLPSARGALTACAPPCKAPRGCTPVWLWGIFCRLCICAHTTLWEVDALQMVSVWM